MGKIGNNYGGYGDGYGDGYGGYGDGGYGDGGYGYGDGDGGCGYGDGGGGGYGDGGERRRFWGKISDQLTAAWVLAEPNAEIKRELIEAMGMDRLYAQAQAQTIHADHDGHGNPRSLLRIPMPEAATGYLLAVRVVCPTTGRAYHLGVPPTVRTCQEAVASLPPGAKLIETTSHYVAALGEATGHAHTVMSPDLMEVWEGTDGTDGTRYFLTDTGVTVTH